MVRLKRTILGVSLLVAASLSGCIDLYQYKELRSSFTAEDGAEILRVLMQQQEIKDAADRVAPLIVKVSIYDPSKSPPRSEPYYYHYADGVVSGSMPTTPDYAFNTSKDMALAVMNADDRFRVFACALQGNAITVEATNLLYAASFSAAKGRILEAATDCVAKTDDAVTYRGLSGVLFNGSMLLVPYSHIARMGSDGDYLVFNEWRAPIAWIPFKSVVICAKYPQMCAAGTPGTSVSREDAAVCKAAVEKAYSGTSPGFDAGLRAAQETKKAAELAACKILYGGS